MCFRPSIQLSSLYTPPISIKLVPTGDGHKQPLYTTPKFYVADISMMSVLDYGSSHVSEVNIPGLLTQFGINAGCKRPGKRATLVFQSILKLSSQHWTDINQHKWSLYTNIESSTLQTYPRCQCWILVHTSQTWSYKIPMSCKISNITWWSMQAAR